MSQALQDGDNLVLVGSSHDHMPVLGPFAARGPNDTKSNIRWRCWYEIINLAIV
jgi:hypothetical protein